MTPYYQNAGITIYCGDCREVLPTLGPVDLVLADPPYPGLKGGTKINFDRGVSPIRKESTTVGVPWGDDISPLIHAWNLCASGMFVFCSHHFADTVPTLIDARPISLVTWYKRNAMPSANNVPQYETEFIWAFKKAPGLDWRKLRGMYSIPMLQAGCMAAERFVDDGSAVHPTQKPKALISALLRIGGTSVLDPYMGTGTTLEAAKGSHISAIGIEIEERYCEIAAKRLSQEVFDFGPVKENQPERGEPCSLFA
jgi:site-specific DNA-methyltransferase (adenine-specific)